MASIYFENQEYCSHLFYLPAGSALLHDSCQGKVNMKIALFNYWSWNTLYLLTSPFLYIWANSDWLVERYTKPLAQTAGLVMLSWTPSHRYAMASLGLKWDLNAFLLCRLVASLCRLLLICMSHINNKMYFTVRWRSKQVRLPGTNVQCAVDL